MSKIFSKLRPSHFSRFIGLSRLFCTITPHMDFLDAPSCIILRGERRTYGGRLFVSTKLKRETEEPQ